MKGALKLIKFKIIKVTKKINDEDSLIQEKGKFRKIPIRLPTMKKNAEIKYLMNGKRGILDTIKIR